MTTLGQRLQTILQERNIKQIDFSKSLGVSANYINLLVNGKKNNISETLAKLIEETYGYSANWILNGTGEKIAKNELTKEKAEILKKIQKMSDNEIKAVLAFVNTLDSIKFKEEEKADWPACFVPEGFDTIPIKGGAINWMLVLKNWERHSIYAKKILLKK